MSWSSNDSLKLWVLILINGFVGWEKDLFYFFYSIKFHLLKFAIWVARHAFLTPLISQSALPKDAFSTVVWVWSWMPYFLPGIYFSLSLRVTLTFFPFLRGDKEMSSAPCEMAAFSVLSQHAVVDLSPLQREKVAGRFERKYGGHCCWTKQETMLRVLAVDRQVDLRGIEILNLLKYYGYR